MLTGKQQYFFVALFDRRLVKHYKRRHHGFGKFFTRKIASS